MTPLRSFCLAAVLALTGGAASAQNINKFVVSDEAAKKTLIKNEKSRRTLLRR